MSQSPTLRLGHISDLHVLALAGVPLRAWASKRVTGLANLALGRRGAHAIAIAEALPAALSAAGVHHVLCTGDLTNLSLDAEFERAAAIIAAIGGPDRVTLIPGNHDVYTRGALKLRRFEEWFAPWLSAPGADEATLAATRASGRAHYPVVRDLSPFVRVYGLSSALPAPPLMAWGEIGAEQLRRLLQLRATEPTTVRQRIVLLHHNLHRRSPSHERTAQLRDRPALAQTLREIGATLILHGHTHAPQQHHLRDDGRPTGIPVLGCGSSTWNRPERGQMAHFNILDVQADGLIAGQAMTWRPERGAFTLERSDLLEQAHRRPLPW